MDTVSEDREDIAKLIGDMVDTCNQHADDTAEDRERALDYYAGKLTDLSVQPGRSKTVKNLLRETVKDIVPSIMRTFFGNRKLVDIESTPELDAQGASAAEAYLNQVVVRESGVKEAVHDAILDALLLRTGILKAVARTKQKKRRIPVMGVDVELAIADGWTLEGDKLVKVEECTVVRIEAVERASWRIFPGARSIEEAPICGEAMLVRRSDLIADGYDRETVDALPAYMGDGSGEDTQRQSDGYDHYTIDLAHELELVEVYDLCVSLDIDGDGIAELYNVVFAKGSDTGDAAGDHVLRMDEIDRPHFAAVCAEREAHQFEGRSFYDDLAGDQKLLSTLLRLAVDNTAWQNNPQPVFDPTHFTKSGIDALFMPSFAKPITKSEGAPPGANVDWMTVPYTAANTLGLIEYLNNGAEERTGVTDTSAGVTPEAFQGMSATASRMVQDKGISQAVTIINELAEGVAEVFELALDLVREHGRPSSVKVNTEWADFDPATLPYELSVRVNVGMGAGSPERDLMLLDRIQADQEKIIAQYGPVNDLVKPSQYYQTLKRRIEISGLPSADPFFTQPDDQVIAQKMAEQAKQPTPEEKLEQAKLQAQMQLKQLEIEASRDKEASQRDADLIVEQARLESRTATEGQRIAAESEREAIRREVEEKRIAQERELKIMELRMKALMDLSAHTSDPERYEAIRAATEGDLGINVLELFRELQAGMGDVTEVQQYLDEHVQSLLTPRELVRDDAGEVVGVLENGMRRDVMRDDAGNITGLQ